MMFKHLKVGDCFKYEEEIYMKIYPTWRNDDNCVCIKNALKDSWLEHKVGASQKGMTYWLAQSTEVEKYEI